jgi:hypothetical protein
VRTPKGKSFLLLFFKKEGRVFFSEEKKQKTFVHLDPSEDAEG